MDWSSWTMATKPSMFLRLRVARPGASAARVSASQKVIDAALGRVEDPAQRDLVGGVDQHPQVGERVAHLLALVEAHPADDLVGLAGADEHLLEDA
jgi:hypothetical protein